MKTLIVGDLHGNLEVIKAALAQKYTDKVVFVGDYLDSFNRNVDDQVFGLLLILEAIENNSDKYLGLFGNHELSYVLEGHMCSGWNPKTDAMVTHLHTRMKRLLKSYTYVGEFLVTHAGLSQHLLDQLGLTPKEYLEKGDFIQIGKARGGCDEFGGIFWCDFNSEFEPVPNLKQVFGHTHYTPQSIFKVKGTADRMSFNIDCLPQYAALNPVCDVALGLVVDEGTMDVEEVNILEI